MATFGWGLFAWGDPWGGLTDGWIAPVFNRTLADCTNKTTKGSLRAEDLNRIEQNMRYLDTRLKNDGYYAIFYTNSEYPWSRFQYFKKAHFNNIKQTILSMQDIFTMYPGITRLTLSGTNVPVSYTEVNLIEYSLYDIKWLLDSAEKMMPKCGDIYCGE